MTRSNDGLKALAFTQMGELSAHQAVDVRHSKNRRGHTRHKNVRMRKLEPDTQFQLDCAGGPGMGDHDSPGFVGPNPWSRRRHCGERLRVSACWVSWANCLQMIREGHPSMAMECVHKLDGQPTVLVVAVECPRAITVSRFVEGFGHESTTTLAGCFGIRAKRQEERVAKRDCQLCGSPISPVSLSTSPTSHLKRLQPHLFRTSRTVEFANFCSLQRAAAGVAVHLIPAATTAQLVLNGGSRSGASVVRQAAGSKSTCSSETR